MGVLRRHMIRRHGMSKNDVDRITNKRRQSPGTIRTPVCSDQTAALLNDPTMQSLLNDPVMQTAGLATATASATSTAPSAAPPGSNML